MFTCLLPACRGMQGSSESQAGAPRRRWAGPASSLHGRWARAPAAAQAAGRQDIASSPAAPAQLLSGHPAAGQPGFRTASAPGRPASQRGVQPPQQLHGSCRRIPEASPGLPPGQWPPLAQPPQPWTMPGWAPLPPPPQQQQQQAPRQIGAYYPAPLPPQPQAMPGLQSCTHRTGLLSRAGQAVKPAWQPWPLS